MYSLQLAPKCVGVPPPYVALEIHLAEIGLRTYLTWITDKDPNSWEGVATLFSDTLDVLRDPGPMSPVWYAQAGIRTANS